MHSYIYIVYIHIQKHTCIYTAHTYIRTYISTYIHTYLTRLYIHSICRFRFWIYTYLYARTHTHISALCVAKRILVTCIGVSGQAIAILRQGCRQPLDDCTSRRRF